MINSENATSEQRRQRLTIRTRRVLGKDGEESVGATAYCPIQEKSVAVAECEGCDRFHALHFDPVTRASSIVCYSHALATSPAEEATPRGLGGPPNPLAPIATIMTKDVLCVRPETALDEVGRSCSTAGSAASPSSTRTASRSASCRARTSSGPIATATTRRSSSASRPGRLRTTGWISGLASGSTRRGRSRPPPS